MAANPLANRSGIEVPKRTCRGIIDNLEAKETRVPRSMKTEYRIGSNTNSIMRHNTKHECARGRADPVDNNVLAGIFKGHIARPIRADIAAVVICDAHIGCRGFRQRPNQEPAERYCEREMARPSTRSPFFCEHITMSDVGVGHAFRANFGSIGVRSFDRAGHFRGASPSLDGNNYRRKSGSGIAAQSRMSGGT
jgi:hypothetical protein